MHRVTRSRGLFLQRGIRIQAVHGSIMPAAEVKVSQGFQFTLTSAKSKQPGLCWVWAALRPSEPLLGHSSAQAQPSLEINLGLTPAMGRRAFVVLEWNRMTGFQIQLIVSQRPPTSRSPWICKDKRSEPASSCITCPGSWSRDPEHFSAPTLSSNQSTRQGPNLICAVRPLDPTFGFLLKQNRPSTWQMKRTTLCCVGMHSVTGPPDIKPTKL